LVENEPAITAPKPVESPVSEDDDNLAGIWQKMALLNEELAQTIQERDHAVSDINLLREQLEQADDLIEKMKGHATPEELIQIARERDSAVAELESLKKKGDSQRVPLPDGISKTKELVFLTQERDQARKEYAELRKQFETLKRDQTASIPNVREDSSKFRKEMEQQLEGFRLKLEEKNREIAELKAKPSTGSLPAIGGGGSGGDEKLKAELGSLRAEAASLKSEVAALKEQVAKAKEDASIAQRGLALSQKALQETRDTLREATEGTSLSRHNFDNLKTECASLTQQITVLQAQNEQLSRELAAAKQRQSGRLTS
jgi:chromosome segregation ATPase